MARITGLARLAWVLLVLGCAARGSRRGASEVDLWLAEADRVWADRGPGAWEALAAPLERIRNRQPAHAEAAWRWVRLGWTRAWMRDDPEAALWDLAQARGEGLACLDVASGFLQGRSRGDWGDAASKVPELRQPCLAWTTLAWATWASRSGDAALQHDREPVLALARQLEAASNPEHSAMGTWSRLLLSAPLGSAEVEEARRLRSKVPAGILLEADLVRLGAEADQTWLKRQEAQFPEERAAMRALREDRGDPDSAPIEGSEGR